MFKLKWYSINRIPLDEFIYMGLIVQHVKLSTIFQMSQLINQNRYHKALNQFVFLVFVDSNLFLFLKTYLSVSTKLCLDVAVGNLVLLTNTVILYKSNKIIFILYQLKLFHRDSRHSILLEKNRFRILAHVLRRCVTVLCVLCRPCRK